MVSSGKSPSAESNASCHSTTVRLSGAKLAINRRVKCACNRSNDRPELATNACTSGLDCTRTSSHALAGALVTKFPLLTPARLPAVHTDLIAADV